jgi:16S rRNA (cytosine967-C5)-methyltransferase
MSRFHSYINTAQKIIETYQGDKPFAGFIKQFFAANKKYGSKDRRQISSFCYNYFRLGFAGKDLSIDEKMMLATFLCEREPSLLLENLQPEWNNLIELPTEKKLAILKTPFSLSDIFPFSDHLSEGIDFTAFCKSFLVQPALFIRIRPQTKTTTLKKLEKSKLTYKFLNESCVQLTTSDNVEEYFTIDKEVVVQDYNSQKVLDYLKIKKIWPGTDRDQFKGKLKVWDCCAASGGKSILLTDILNEPFDLIVSDVRASIILNLHQRFKRALIKEYKYFIADISIPDFGQEGLKPDIIICDAPCSGSGTWSRTPEQLYFFKKQTIAQYSTLQKKIIGNAISHLRSEGLFIYITCSVFKEENEEIAALIEANYDCKLLQQQLLTGYNLKADSMFVAVFQKL